MILRADLVLVKLKTRKEVRQVKELIRPNSIEMAYSSVEGFSLLEECTNNCRGCDRVGDVCNKHCSDGATNRSAGDDKDILF